MNKPKPAMSVLTLVMINIIAIDSLRGIPMSASYGFSLLFYYIVCALLFFIPSSLVSAELTTGWPKKGGVYIWVREAFGKPLAFAVIFIQWIYNICWYPTVLSLLAATLAYIINPELASNRLYMLGVVFTTYWLITAITLRGMHVSGMLSTITAIIGTLIPMAFISVLGLIWVLKGNPISMEVSFKAFLPELKPASWVLLTGVLYSLVGMEMSAVHVQDVKDPQRNYPKALYYSTIIILITLTCTSLAVAAVVPAGKLNLVTGLLDAFNLFFRAFHMEWLMPVVATLIIIGVIGGVGAWIIGPTRGLLAAAEDGCVPKFMQKVNMREMPFTLLIIQGIIFSVLCLVFLIMPSVNSSFWILSNLTHILALSSYIFIFAAAIYLRYKKPEVKRSYKVPFGNIGMWIVGVAGIIASAFTIMIGFIPPSQISIGNIFFYEAFLVVGFFGFYLIPMIIYRLTKR